MNLLEYMLCWPCKAFIGPEDGFMWRRQVELQAKANPTDAPEWLGLDTTSWKKRKPHCTVKVGALEMEIEFFLILDHSYKGDTTPMTLTRLQSRCWTDAGFVAKKMYGYMYGCIEFGEGLVHPIYLEVWRVNGTTKKPIFPQESVPLRRLGTPEEVIQTVMFLLSEDRLRRKQWFAVWLEVFQIALHATAANYLAPFSQN